MTRRAALQERILLTVSPVVYTHPFEIAVAVASFLIGLTLLLTDAGATGSGFLLAPTWTVKVWQVMMLAGGPLTLLGLFWRKEPSVGMALERAGLIVLASAWGTRAVILVLTAFSAEVVFVGGLLIAAPLYLVVGLSCQIRASVIRRSLAVARRVAATGR